MSEWSVGARIDRYRIDGGIGSGSTGEVYRAFDLDLERPIALKILSASHRENDELRARFLREGRAVAKVTHPHVVQVFSTGTHDGRPYIAMELLRGVDLESVVSQRGPWGSRAAARAALDATRGLQAASAAGLIHRDVKPSNLVLVETGFVKVTDFGLAKPVDPSQEPALTAQGVVVGTPDYIAPEQARGERIDERVDIYALGGTLYFLLTGWPPFRLGESSEDKYLKVVARHLKFPAPDARKLRPEVDGELAELSRAMMEKRPADRPDYPQVARALAGIVKRLPPPGGSDPGSSSSGGSGRGRPRVAPTPFVGRPPGGDPGGLGARSLEGAGGPTAPPARCGASDSRGRAPPSYSKRLP